MTTSQPQVDFLFAPQISDNNRDYGKSTLSDSRSLKASKSSCKKRWLFTALFADELLKHEQEQARLNEARKISVVNVNPTNIRPHSDTPEIRKYKKRFNSEILCAALWGEAGRTALRPAAALAAQANQQTGACFHRGESAGGHGERPDAAGSKRSRQSLQSDQPTALPADGRPGRT